LIKKPLVHCNKRPGPLRERGGGEKKDYPLKGTDGTRGGGCWVERGLKEMSPLGWSDVGGGRPDVFPMFQGDKEVDPGDL